MTDDDIEKDLRVSNKLHRKAILNSIAKIQSGQSDREEAEAAAATAAEKAREEPGAAEQARKKAEAEREAQALPPLPLPATLPENVQSCNFWFVLK